jgi:long-chain acyl-CoA synthetase
MSSSSSIYSSFLENPSSLTNPFAIIHGSQKISWADLEKNIESLAELFLQNGLEQGDRVLISMQNSIEYFLLLFSITKAGGVAVVVDIATAPKSISHVVSLTTPRWLFTQDANSSRISESNNTWMLKLARNPAHLESKKEKTAPPGSLIMLSSGSTGQPKCIPLSGDNFNFVFENMSRVMFPEEGHRELLISSACHMDGLQRAALTFKKRGTLVLFDGALSMGTLFEALESEKIDGMYLPPALVAPLVSANFIAPKSLKHIELGSASHPAEHLLGAQKMLSTKNVFVHYGLTECSRATILDLKNTPEKITSIGKAYNGLNILIVDEALAPVATGEKGQILLAGKQTIDCYFKNEFKERFHKNGFLTGDYGYLDKDGYLFFSGRKDELTTRSGYHLYPLEIEANCVNIPGLVEIIFVSLPQKESPGNDLLIAHYTSDCDLTPEDVRTQLKELLPSHQIPDIIKRESSIPRTSSGKVDRLKLKNAYRQNDS